VIVDRAGILVADQVQLHFRKAARIFQIRLLWRNLRDGTLALAVVRECALISVLDPCFSSCSVDFHFDCTGPAAEAVRPGIEQLANSIDQQLATRRWIGTPKPPGAVEHAER
jgi:hypothetical protein